MELIHRGWECPRCGKINAPWKEECRCYKEPSYSKTFTIPLGERWNTLSDDMPSPTTSTTSGCGDCNSCKKEV